MVTVKPITETEIEMTDVKPGTEYEFRVIAENEAGLSEPSETSGVVKCKDPWGALTRMGEFQMKKTSE
jgi:titin